jgi:hypothetical protein
VLLFIGKPLYFLEMALGQFSSYGSVKIWEVVPILRGTCWSLCKIYICPENTRNLAIAWSMTNCPLTKEEEEEKKILRD